MAAFEEGGEVLLEPVSPSGQYFNSSIMHGTVLAVFESEVPIDDSLAKPLLENILLPINPRFSSIMVKDIDGNKKWKKVEVDLEEHIYVATFPSGLSPQEYDSYFDEYLTKMTMEHLPQNKPLWEVHVIKYPTSNAAGNLVFKLHHALGDGYSLMGALLSCFERADNPSLPLTFPSRKSSQDINGNRNGVFSFVPQVLSLLYNSIADFGWSTLKSTMVDDDRTPIRSGEDGVEFRPIVISTMTFSLDQINEIKTKLRVTVNDVLTGILFFGLRLYMEEMSGHDQSSYESKSTALVMLNTRMIGISYKSINEMIKPNTNAPWGNHIAFLHVPIPNLSDSKLSNPLIFVKDAQNMIKKKRTSLGVVLTGKLVDMVKKVKGTEEGARYVFRTLKNSTTSISNLIGPVEKMALANHPAKGLYFMMAGGPQNMSITIVSYMGDLRIAFGTEKGFIDEKKLKTCIQSAFDKIQKASLEGSL